MSLVKRMIDYCLDHPVLANVSMWVIFIFGFLACLYLPVQFLPDFNPDVLVVIATRDDASAQTMQDEVMRAVDPHLYGLPHLDSIEGHARDGVCFWVMRFEVGKFGADIIDQVQAKLARAQLSNIDYRVERPRMRHPVLSFVLWGPEKLSELVGIARQAKIDLLALGIDDVKIQGVEKDDIMLSINARQLHGLSSGVDELAQQLKQSLAYHPINSGRTESLPVTSASSSISTQGTLDQLLRSSVSGMNAGSLITMTPELPIQSPRVFYHNKPAVSITVNRSIGGSDIFSLQQIFKQWYQHFVAKWGDVVHIKIYDETWRLLAYRIWLLVNNGMMGLFLILVLLGVFFHYSLAKWIASGIPICIAVSCVMLYLLGGTINFLSTFAFVMALGIIVDDTIVVAEQAYSEFQQGKSPRQAAQDACQMMFLPIMAASLTTIASFVPLLIIPGEYGKIMIDIPRVIICVLIASVIECFLILPRHVRTALERFPKQLPHWQESLQLRMAHFQHQQLKRVLVWVSRHAIATISVGVLVVSLPFIFLMTGRVPFSFFPSPPQDIILMDTSFHAGVTDQVVLDYLKQADRALSVVNDQLSQPSQAIVETPLQFAYQSAPKSLVQFNKGVRANHASMIIGLSLPDQRQVSNQTLIDRWYASIPRLPGVKNISITEPRAGPPTPDIKILIKGHDSQQLKRASEALQLQLASYAGVHGISDNMPHGPMELQIKLNHRAKALGLSKQQLERELSRQITHAEIKRGYADDEEVTIDLQLSDQDLARNDMLYQLPIHWNGYTDLLGNLVEINLVQGFSRFYSFNSQAGVLVTAETGPVGSTVREVIGDLQKQTIAKIMRDHQVEVSFETQARSQSKALEGIRSGAIIAVMLIYAVLAWVLRSYTWPLVVMAVIPVGLSGAIWGHYLLGMHLTILSIFGLFGLTGIVVNDSIILLHRFQHAYQSQSVGVAMIHACCERFRAVVLTSLTTIIGMAPLLLNKSLQAQFIIPLAVSISGGLLLATTMLIVFLPAIAAIIQRFCHSPDGISAV